MNKRAAATIGVAVLLILSLVWVGAWVLGSGAQGAAMINDSAADGQMMGPVGSGMTGQVHTMGPASNRGLLGGYVGSLGALMVLLLLGAVGSLVVAYAWERPGGLERAECPHCQRPVETDWASCPYCGESLEPTARGERPP